MNKDDAIEVACGLIVSAISTVLVYVIGVLCHDIWRWYAYLIFAFVVYLVYIHSPIGQNDNDPRY